MKSIDAASLSTYLAQKSQAAFSAKPSSAQIAKVHQIVQKEIEKLSSDKSNSPYIEDMALSRVSFLKDSASEGDWRKVPISSPKDLAVVEASLNLEALKKLNVL